MRSLIAAIVYLGTGLLVTHPRAAIGQAVFFGLSLFLATKLTGAKSTSEAMSWFKRYPGRGLIVAALSMGFLVISLISGAEAAETLLALPLTFTWFWAFSAFGASASERTIAKAVKAELDRRESEKNQGEGGDAP